MILPSKSRLAFLEIKLVLRARGRGTTKDLDSVGTPHFAQFVPLEDNQIGFFTVYDGTFDDYIADFTKHIGHVFDLIFKFTKNPPPSPCQKHLQEFIDFAAAANRAPIGFYQAYPGLTVQDIHRRMLPPNNASRSAVARMRRVSAPEPNSKSLTWLSDATSGWQRGSPGGCSRRPVSIPR